MKMGDKKEEIKDESGAPNATLTRSMVSAVGMYTKTVSAILNRPGAYLAIRLPHSTPYEWSLRAENPYR